MSQLEVDKIIPQSGTTLTIGDSGDTISFADGATLAIDTNTLAIDSTNNRVGIGTTSPDRILHLEGALPIIKGTDTDGGYGELSFNAGRINIKADDGNNVATSYITFEVDGSEHARIDSSGNLGIGTSSPNSPQAVNLHISGTSSAIRMSDTTNSLTGNLYASGGEFSVLTSSSHPLTFKTANSERMRIASNGRVGIGTTSPERLLHLESAAPEIMMKDSDDNSYNTILSNGGTLSITTSAAGTLKVEPLGASSVQLASATTLGFNVGSGYSYEFDVDGSEVMRITSSGELLVGTTSSLTTSGKLTVQGSSSDDQYLAFIKNTNTNLGQGMVIRVDHTNNREILQCNANGNSRFLVKATGDVIIGATSTPDGSSGGIGFIAESNSRRTLITASTTTSETTLVVFRNPNGTVGGINTSGSSTAFNTSSDYRLKENVVDMTGATERLKQLSPKRFNFIADADTTVDGFLAHEVQSIIPEAITGTKDEVDADGNPVYQGIDQSKLVPLLVATIKELEARITALET